MEHGPLVLTVKGTLIFFETSVKQKHNSQVNTSIKLCCCFFLYFDYFLGI